MSSRVEQSITIVVTILDIIGSSDGHRGNSTDNFLSESISFGTQRRDVQVFLIVNGWCFQFQVFVWCWLHRDSLCVSLYFILSRMENEYFMDTWTRMQESVTSKFSLEKGLAVSGGHHLRTLSIDDYKSYQIPTIMLHCPPSVE